MSDHATLDALILDFGGVLFLPHNSPERQRWLDRIGWENEAFEAWMWSQPEALAAMRGELTEAEFWTGIGAQVGLSAEDSLAMAADYWAGDELNMGAVALARRAREHGLRTGLLSNAYSDLGPYLAKHGLLELFDECIISALVGKIKPDLAIYELACSTLQVQPQRALFVDDNWANVEAARAHGLHALHYVGPETLAKASVVLGLPQEP